MMIWLAILVGCAVVAIGFVFEPLVGAADDGTPRDGSWPGTLFHHEFDDDAARPSADPDKLRAEADTRWCYACGTSVDPDYTYCAECLTPTI